ncbi:sulfotransferase family cytosolic 1B member 1-like [Penaeus japonicus]|uniref:sulfotransferase family cytosolic 1B member 1-like n=1 Tax=Penaeus japonicus TaxID=27405 RepID=UPI001C7166B3|nr:sulfotransferase family cytosolic 1B member 1-like [Penaeus japonicus]
MSDANAASQDVAKSEHPPPEGTTLVPLPKGLLANDAHYLYKGCVFPGTILRSGMFEEVLNFEFRSSDVIVSSFPKTGTTWTQEIVYMLTHGCQKTQAEDGTLETRFPFLEFPFPGVRAVAALEDPRCIKTHLPYHLLPKSLASSRAKMVYVTRNPRDTAISYYHFTQLLTVASFKGTLSDYVNLFLEDKAMYSPFFPHVLGYWEERRDPNILFITYEEMHQDPLSVIRRIAQFLQVEASERQLEYVAACTSFASMASNPSVNYEHWKESGFCHKDKGSFLRKGKVGGWKESLTPEQIEAFQQWEDKHLAGSDFHFTFTSGEKEGVINTEDFKLQNIVTTNFQLYLTFTLLAMYNPFFPHVLGYWEKRRDPNILFITYEEMHQDPLSVIRRIAQFLQVEASERQLEYVAACTSFASMASNPSVNYEHWKESGFCHKDKGSFLRKGKVGGWKESLTPEQIEAFQQWEDKHLAGSDFRFTFTSGEKE